MQPHHQERESSPKGLGTCHCDQTFERRQMSVFASDMPRTQKPEGISNSRDTETGKGCAGDPKQAQRPSQSYRSIEKYVLLDLPRVLKTEGCKNFSLVRATKSLEKGSSLLPEKECSSSSSDNRGANCRERYKPSKSLVMAGRSADTAPSVRYPSARAVMGEGISSSTIKRSRSAHRGMPSRPSKSGIAR